MRKSKAVVSALIGLIFVFGAGCQTDDHAELKTFADRFSGQIKAGELRELRKDEIKEMEFYGVSAEMKKAEWFAPFHERVGGYERLFVANVKTKEGEAWKCFYSKLGSAYQPVGMFTDKSGTWRLID